MFEKDCMSPNVLFEFGEQCRKNKNIKKAKDYYLEAIKKDPEHQWSLTRLGDCYYSEKDYNRAIKYYLKYIEINQKNENVFKKLGDCYYSEKDYNQAIKYYLKYIGINQKNENVFEKLGDCYYYLDTEEGYHKAFEYYSFVEKCFDYTKRFNCYRKIVDSDPQNLDALVKLGDCYNFGNGVGRNVNIAIKYYKKVVELIHNTLFCITSIWPDAYCETYFECCKKINCLKSNDANICEKLARCYEKGIGTIISIKDAIKYYKKVVKLTNDDKQLFYVIKKLNKLEPDNIDTLEKIGNCYYYGKGTESDYDYAIIYYKKCIENSQNDEQFFILCKRVYNLNPNDTYICKKLGDCYLYGKGTEQSYNLARNYYEKVIERKPNDAYVLEKLADCYSYEKLSIQKAIDYYKIAIERIFEIYNNRSNKYFTDEEKRSIFYCYKRINKFDSENFEALSVLGLCYKNGVGTKKDKTHAIFCFKRASELSKDDKEQLFCYKNIFELSPNDSVNCEKLVDYYLDKNTEEDTEVYIEYYKKYIEIGTYNNKKIQCCKKIIEKETDKIEVFEYRVKLSEFDSTDADNWKELGDCYLDIGIDKYKAIDCYKEFCKLSKDNGKRFNYYEKIYELNSQDIKNLVNLADSYRYGNGIEISVSKAIAFYKKAIDCTSDYEIKILLYEQINELDTTDTYVIEKLAEYYCTKGKISYYKKAYLQYKKLTELDSNSANYWEQLGICYEYGLGTERNNNEAINCYKKVIKLEMDYGHKQKFCEKIIELNPNDTYALNNLGDLWYKKGNKNKASEFYEKVIEIDPNYVRSYYGLKNCYNGEKKFECLLKIHELNPDDNIIELFYTDIECLEKLGDCYNYGIGTEKNKDNAIKCYKKVIELSKDDKQIFECYNKIIELEPNDADILYMLAFCYYHGKGCRKNYSESFDYCKKAKNLDIKYSNAWNNLRS